MKDTLYIVIPCYNEEEVLHEAASRVKEVLNSLIKKNKAGADSKIVFVDDGSKDKTWQIIKELFTDDDIFVGLKLSANKGHQNALLAGLSYAKENADVSVSMDADLQDDVNAVEKFMDMYIDGCDVVYGVRSDRKKDSFFKRNTAQGFYKLMKLLGVDIVYNHADYRLMSKRALEGLTEFKEVNLFLRGIVPLIGYKFAVVEYERGERFAGESKYPLKKMISFALDAITSFSVKPIRLIMGIGFLIFIVSLFMLAYFLFQRLFGYTVTGWTSTVISIWMIGGVQLLCTGIIGEYIGKIYKEVKGRPKYFIEDILSKK